MCEFLKKGKTEVERKLGHVRGVCENMPYIYFVFRSDKLEMNNKFRYIITVVICFY